MQKQFFNNTNVRRTSRGRPPESAKFPPPQADGGIDPEFGSNTTVPQVVTALRRDADGNVVEVKRLHSRSEEEAWLKERGLDGRQMAGPPWPNWGWSHLDDFEGIAYMIEIQIGTPPQRVAVSVDTGSYEMWVNPKCLTAADPQMCSRSGHYFPEGSSTAKNDGGKFQIQYGTGSALGQYWQDTMKVAMFQVPSLKFAVASDTNYTWSGVLGLGYNWPWTTNYPTLITMLWALGYIAAPVFSMGLGGESDGVSEVIFGGVNRWKYAGPLEPVEIWPPIEQQDPSWLQYWVNVTSVGMSKPDGNRFLYTTPNFNMPMLIDSGSTLSYIRRDVVNVIATQLGAVVDQNGNYWVDCNLKKQKGTVDIGFNHGRVVISISYKDFIWEQWHNHCLMGFQPADPGENNFVLGSTFLRGAYVVFDQQLDVVWLADYYNCGDGVILVGKEAGDTGWVTGQC